MAKLESQPTLCRTCGKPLHEAAGVCSAVHNLPAYTMRLCGDCSYGPPCRCSSDPAEVKREWISGGWVWVAHCKPEASPA